MPSFEPCRAKMEAEGIAPSAIAAFESTFASLLSGNTGIIPETSISPVPDLDSSESFTAPPDTSLLSRTVVLKLNGGLGTGMGLDKAKSLLVVASDGDTFLDLTAKQVLAMRQQYQQKVKFMLMNSFSTSADTMEFLQRKYPGLAAEDGLEMMQNKVPKINQDTLEPAVCPSNPDNEWCPPGHGDLYAALVGSGRLEELLNAGYLYMFVSNSDNLGASLDLSILTYFAAKGAPFLMECCQRTENDKKGGHLAVRTADGKLVLRESAMCAPEDEDDFSDISKHKFFNTNNLWIRLDKLKEIIDTTGGFIPLPMIMNKKTVDPKDDDSTKVLQLETAMGAAIECFDGAAAIVVPRTRFAPVKKCSDLLLLRSDAYLIQNHQPVLSPAAVGGTAPVIDIDSKLYKLVENLEEATVDGIPSLVQCRRLKIKGLVRMSRKTRFVGDVSIVNTSKEAKFVPSGVVSGDLDLSSATGLGMLQPNVVATTPIPGQLPGTSGLRKKVKEFMQENYLNNFVQATFDAIKETGVNLTIGTLLIGGDGRYFNPEAIQLIIKMGVANGVKRFWIGQNGLLSTPAVSAIIRERGPQWQKVFGAFILTASHNPGGPDEDFGIKFNCSHGEPAPEKVTDAIYEITTKIKSYKISSAFPTIDIDTLGLTTIKADDGSTEVNVEVISSTDAHVDLLKSIFDFKAIKVLLDRPDFSMVYDTMYGVNGPYARKVLVEELGQSEDVLMNATPKDDFNGGHADPNLTYAKELVATMGLDRTGQTIEVAHAIPAFGAAADGDGDRNMILGKQFFVSPSDSLAVIVANADDIPFFRSQGGLKGVARSMPTSGAVDLVAKDLNLKLFETPTGWKYFGNLMDSKEIYGGEDFTPFVCGEESFGTGSNHVREKDGIWAVLAWLSILAKANQDASQPLVSVEDIVTKHWMKYGRNYYSRWDFEGVDKVKATAMMDKMRADVTVNTGKTVGKFVIATADDFVYHDPVDHSVTMKQGIRFLMSDGSRVVFRLSGTAGSGATVRMYIEQYEPTNINMVASQALADLIRVALDLSDLKGFLGTETPTVIT